jgi:5'-nucleotidase
VALDGTRNSVRNVETNEGNLLADALLWQATELATDFGINVPDVALQNGGGIRNNTVIDAGDITVLDTFDVAPFSNFVTVIEDIPRSQFKTILENAVSDLPGGGRFAQVAGFSFVYDQYGIPMVIDGETGAVTQIGNRIVDVMLDDGTVIVDGGAVVAGDPINIATIDFLARGGDQYPYDGAPFTSVGVTYQQALANYIADGLGGTITAADYPEGGEGRVTTLPAPTDFGLVIHHNNDGESQLVNAGSGLEAYGGAARFANQLEIRRRVSSDTRFGDILLSSGDNFLAGPEFNASLEKGVPFYDTIAMDMFGYDAVAIGNHDFDFGPDVLADFIEGYNDTMPPYVSANLGFADEPRLQALADAGRIVKSTVITERGMEIGIVGATTPNINFISSPRNVDVMDDVAGAVQAEVDALTASGVKIIILISHLQDINEDIELAALLSDVDVMIAGGGDELLANPGNPLVPGEEDDVFGPYPMVATDADGVDVPVVTTPGEYKYLGELWIGFDPDGNTTLWGGRPVLVEGGEDADVLAAVTEPVVAATAALDATVIGTSEVALDGTRTSVRAEESNEGNLIADALRWQATELAADFGVSVPDVAIQNGGGIRNNTVIAAGDISLLDTFDMVPFPNFVTVLEDIGRDQFKEILENAYSQVPGGGRFAQISGFTVTYDANQTAQVLNDDGTVDVPGARIISAALDDGTVLVEDGAVVAGDPLTIATIDFLARGGDQYPYRGAPFTSVGVSYQQALANYITDGLGGTITAADYPEGGEGRITALEVISVDGPFTPIYEIQGSGDESPLDGETVEVSGYVTGVFPDLGGFYLQEGTGDGDATTSDGIFVAVTNGVAVGDLADVRGTVEEFFGETRLVDVDAVEVEDTGGAIAATEVSLPLAEGASLEAYEGMLVTFPNYLFVSDTFNLHRFGEAVLAEGGVLVNPTDIAAPGDAAIALAAANTARQIVIDDGSDDQFPDAVPYFGADGTLRRGDAAKDITANLSFSFGAYKLQPTAEVSFERMNPRPAAPDDVGGNLTVASFNVLNFFSTIDDGDNGARGADSEAEKAAQLDKLVAAIGGLGADIIGIQEIENNGPVAIGELIDGLNAKYGAGTWAAAADPEYPGGLEATNAIKVGIIFKTASVTPIGVTEVSEDPVFGADRPPIAHSFIAFGETFTVVNNHFKSKSSSNAEGADLDQGDGQGAYNARRTAQAAALLDFMAELAESTGDPDVLVIGDFNSYALEDPITALEAGGLTNLVKANLTPEDSYSLVFFGAQGLLDGAFATASLADSVTGVDIWHINADEPRVLQYNDDVVDPAERSSDFNQPVSQPDVYSSSDHDPLIVGLQLGGDSPITLGYSTANDRSAPALLDGATVSGKVWASVLPLDPGLGFTTVDFYLDGEKARTEYLAPYDFAGGLLTMATAWDSTSVADGAHTMKAVGNLPDGGTIEASATFTVDNAPAAADFALAVSGNAHRTNPVMLDGATVFGEVYPFVYPLFPDGFESFGTVSFYLDGAHFHTEYAAPYDFVSGATDKATAPWDTTTVADGEHTIKVVANRTGMQPLTAEVTFTVDNAAQDIVDVAVADGRFTTLVAAVQAAGLEGALRGLGPFTVFAPTDDAFAALPPGTVEALLADPDALADILLYHVVAGAVDAATVVGLDRATTLQGSDVTIEVVDGAVILNGTVKVIITDVAAANGIIHVIDGVLIPPVEPIRFATFNASLNRFNAGDLVADLSTPDNEQAKVIAEIIQRTRPEVLLLNEFDYDAAGEGARLFQENYLSVSQNGAEPIDYGYAFSAPSNTGIPSGLDLDNSGDVGGPNDAFGFGFFPGQFGMQVYSQYPIDFANVRTFQEFLWADMPGARLPVDPDTGPWYSEEELAAVRLSSKSHWDVPIVVDDGVVNFLVSHPTPPVFDGPEDRNGTRNADEIRFWADYINGAAYIYDDAGVSGGWSGDYFVIAGDQNSDPLDGDSIPGSAQQLLDDPRVNATMTPASAGAVEQDGLQGGINESHLSDPAFDTADFSDTAPGNLRADYVLPSANLDIADSGVFWPASTDSLFSLVGTFPFPSSDHRLVWVDLLPGTTALPPAPAPLVNLQILAINDFHGNIATTSSAFGGVGRADYLSTNMAAAEAGVENSIIVSAGDLIGASPLVSALFHDEPTIEAMNLIGLEINGVGNHEFDEGADELLRLQNGGSHPVDGDLDGDGFAGADFEFLAANVTVDATGETIFAPYTIKEYGGVEVAFIGMTLEGTPSIVTPAGVAGLTFNDEVETVNALVPGLQAQGIEAIVVLMHEGGVASEGGGDGDGCGTLSGNLFDIVTGLDDAVDLVIGGHNNQRFTCLDVEGKAVTMAYHSGRMFTDIDVTLDPATGDMTVVSVDNKENFQDGVTPDAAVTALIDKYEVLAAPLAGQVIGEITADVTRTNNAAGESALGDVIADAQLAATSSPTTGNAVVAFMNPGGIRGDILFDAAGGPLPGQVSFGEAFRIQPFGNSLVTMTLTGAQIHELLTSQWVGQTSPRILQVSEGFSYTWDANKPDAEKVDPATIMINGVVVDPAAEYRVTVNSFMADGGDNFSVLLLGTNLLGGEVDLDALVTYFGTHTPPGVSPGPQNRITRLAVSSSLAATLTGAAEVPGPGDEDGTGTATVEIDGTTVTWTISVAGIETPAAAHIHTGASGLAGGVVVNLLGDGAFTDNGDGTFSASGTVEIDGQLASDIAATPGDFYVNVHNAAFAPGAVRGQLGEVAG